MRKKKTKLGFGVSIYFFFYDTLHFIRFLFMPFVRRWFKQDKLPLIQFVFSNVNKYILVILTWHATKFLRKPSFPYPLLTHLKFGGNLGDKIMFFLNVLGVFTLLISFHLAVTLKSSNEIFTSKQKSMLIQWKPQKLKSDYSTFSET